MKIFLVGMMGSGKSYWTQRLAKKLKLPKYDLDNLIEDVEDRTVQQIFAESGEAHFRQMESIVLKWFADKDTYILATGGGTPCFHNNIEWMNRYGLTVWLDEPIPVLAERLAPQKAQRPLISELDDRQIVEYLITTLEKRLPCYRQARLRLSGADINEQNLLSLIKQQQHA